MKNSMLGLLLLAAPAAAYDSLCEQADGKACTGLEAARQPWGDGEHAQIWRRSRALAGLPASVDEAFDVTGLIVERPLADGQTSLAAAPLDLVDGFTTRQVAIPLFAQLPDFSFALWDWSSGNEACPPAGTSAGPDLCHEFAGHLSWLNSTHFLPSAGRAFAHFHGLALDRAAECAAIPRTASTLPVRVACDREALLVEAVAHHFLQDAWSMGHMWQRWGSSSVDDFRAQLVDGLDVVTLEQHAKAIGIASGIIHGAKAITGFDDALCAPGPGIDWVLGGVTAPGAGDLFWSSIDEGERFDEQLLQMLSCTAAAQRAVYLASSRSLGEPVALANFLTNVDPRSDICLGQRATNTAMFTAAAIELPSIDVNLDQHLVDFLDEFFVVNLDLSGQDALARRVPLTAEVLGQVIVPNVALLRPLWAEDMRTIRGVINRSFALDPAGTSLADGGLPSLLGMRPNGAYDIGEATYFDPPLPWTPTATPVPLEPLVENAGNILARTFVDAHASDWCAAFAANSLEASLLDLREAAEVARGTEREGIACNVCTQFAAWHLWPSAEQAFEDADAPLCRLLGSSAAVIQALTPEDLAFSQTFSVDDVVAGDASLAELWCGCPGAIVIVRPNSGSVCADSDQTSPAPIRIALLNSDGSAGALPPVDVFITGAPSGAIETTLNPAGFLEDEVTLGGGLHELRVEIPEVGLDQLVSFTIDEIQCLPNPCEVFFSTFGDRACSTNAESDPPECCCCV
jgi:hypothetical protein